MIDDDTLKQLLRINDELMQLCKWLNEKRDMATSSRRYTSSGRPDPHFDRSWQEQTTLMKPYKGYFITSSAMPVHHLTRTGMLAAAFWCRVAVVQSWRSRAFSLGSP